MRVAPACPWPASGTAGAGSTVDTGTFRRPIPAPGRDRRALVYFVVPSPVSASGPALGDVVMLRL